MLLLLISKGYIPEMATREICSTTFFLPWQAVFFIFPAPWGLLNLQSQTQELAEYLEVKFWRREPRYSAQRLTMATMVQLSSVSFETVHEQIMSPVRGENTFDL